ncbi:MAG: HD domain-containing protein [Candidatus Contendobacter sp.]|nr:HD domain-containing protein [Candidatus Contendobacter sp.]
MDKRYDEHYVKSVVTLGDSRNVYANQAIFTSKKIKLVEKGTKIDSSLFDRLVSHKLIPKIDDCLSIENGITPERLREYAQNLLDNDPGMAVLRGQRSIRERMLNAFSDINLLAPLAFKLTVASTQRPEVFDHSIRVALISLYLGRKGAFLSEREMALLATAAVFHDLGILHVSPELMQPGRRLGESERHHLYAHPITGFMILSEYPEYHPDVSRTVFEHHERLDGSGYPRGLKEDEICFGAQILMLAEVVNTVFERTPASQSLAKLSILLRLNLNKFNPELCNQLITILDDIKNDAPVANDPSRPLVEPVTLEPRLIEIAQIFQDWKSASQHVSDKLGEHRPDSLWSIIDLRIADLKRTLLHTGFNLDQPADLVDVLREDPEALSELDILIGETRWQLAEIIYEVHRRMSNMTESLEALQPSILSWLERSKKVIELN